MNRPPIQQKIPFGTYTPPARTQQAVRSSRRKPTLNVMRAVKAAMKEDAKQCGMSRAEIVDGMNGLAKDYGVCLAIGNGKELKLDTFEKWVNPEEIKREPPLKAIPFFCAVTGRCSAINALVDPIGLQVIGGDDIELLTMARNQEAAEYHSKIVKQIKKRRYR